MLFPFLWHRFGLTFTCKLGILNLEPNPMHVWPVGIQLKSRQSDYVFTLLFISHLQVSFSRKYDMCINRQGAVSFPPYPPKTFISLSGPPGSSLQSITKSTFFSWKWINKHRTSNAAPCPDSANEKEASHAVRHPKLYIKHECRARNVVCHLCCHYRFGLDRYGIFGANADADTDIRE